MKTITTCMILMICSVTFAQDVKIDWGPDYKKDGGLFSLIRFGGFTNKAYYVVEQSLKHSQLHIFDFKHNLLADQELDYKFGKSDMTLSDVLSTKSSNYFLMGGYDKKENKIMMAFTTPTPSNLLNTNYTKIIEYPYNYKQPFGIMGVSVNINFDADEQGVYMSYDSTKVMYLYSKALQDSRSDNQVVSFLLLDDKMKELYKVNKSIPYNDSKFNLIDNSVMNNGDVYIAGKYYENDKDRKTPNYKFHILKFTSAAGYKDILVKLNDAAPLNGSVVDLENGNVMIVGSYTNLSNNNSMRANGTYSLILNASGEIVSNNIYPFSGEVKEELFGENERKEDRGAVAYIVKGVIFERETKSMTICFEKDYTTTRTVYTTTGVKTSSMSNYHTSTKETTTTYYHTDDIILARFNMDGKREFESFIDKRFSFPNTNQYNSFSFCAYKGNYYFLFNDAKTLSERKEADVSGKIVTDLVKMSPEGKIIWRKTLFGNRDIDMMFAPKLSVFLWKNEMLIHGSYNKKYKYGILHLPD